MDKLRPMHPQRQIHLDIGGFAGAADQGDIGMLAEKID
jgi:hypothetical protein